MNQTAEVLRSDDLEMEAYIRSFYGEDCVLDDCRRLEHDSDVLHPFILNSVESTITSTYTCENNNTCYNVDTSANVTQYPVMFPEKRSSLIVVSKVLDFMEEREIEIEPLVPIPQTVTTEISITFKGVQSKELDEEDEEEFIETVFDFLEEILGLFDPPILVEDVQFNSQTLTVDVIATEVPESSSNSRQAGSGLNETSDEYASITINVTVVGEYLPPPEIDFDDVVVEVFDEEGQEDFIEAIDENDIEYFEPVIDKVSVKVVTVEKIEVQNSKGNGLFGDLGDDVGIALIAAPFVFIVIVLILLGWRKHIRHKDAAKNEEDLKNQNLAAFDNEDGMDFEFRSRSPMDSILYLTGERNLDFISEFDE